MSEVILEVKNLCKSLKKRPIVKDINFHVQKGEIMGFLGPNGAGKTTTIRMLTGLIKPDAGDITICGHSITEDFEKAIEEVGAIVETPHLYEYMSGLDNIKFFAGLHKGVTEAHIQEAIKVSGLENRLKDKVKNYSLGMKQRLALATVLLHHPSLLILDEPTNGLDPAGIRALRDFLKEKAHKEGCSVLVSSHILAEMQLLCDRIAIISKGEIKCIKPMSEIGDQLALESLFIEETGGDNLI